MGPVWTSMGAHGIPMGPNGSHEAPWGPHGASWGHHGVSVEPHAHAKVHRQGPETISTNSRSTAIGRLLLVIVQLTG